MKKNFINVNVIISTVETSKVFNKVADNVVLYVSNDFNLLKCFEGNRVGCLEQLESESFTNTEKKTFITRVNKLREVIRQKGFDKNFPILVAKINGELYIVDGQGRYTACQMENVPFYYRILDGNFASISDAIAYAMRMNCLQTPWRSSDKYRAACIMFDKPDLLNVLTKYNAAYGISNNNILMLLYGQNACKRATFDANRIKDETISELSYYFLEMVCKLRQMTYNKILRYLPEVKARKILNEKYVHAFANMVRKNPNLNCEDFSTKVAKWWIKDEAYTVNRNTSQMTAVFNIL